MSKGIVFSIEEFAINDGPGIRTAVFLKGCPLRCAWCHNPEGQSFRSEPMRKKDRTEVCGVEMEADELARRVLRGRDLFDQSGGGVTFTGGEPTAQGPFLLELLALLAGVHRAVETCGHTPEPLFRQVLDATDLMLFDVKMTDPERHRYYTGVDNALILRNLATLKESGKPFIVRVPLIPGVNDSAEDMRATAALLQDAPGLQRVELLRYHKTAGAKYPMVGRRYEPPFDVNATPAVHDAFTPAGMKLLVL